MERTQRPGLAEAVVRAVRHENMAVPVVARARDAAHAPGAEVRSRGQVRLRAGLDGKAGRARA